MPVCCNSCATNRTRENGLPWSKGRHRPAFLPNAHAQSGFREGGACRDADAWFEHRCRVQARRTRTVAAEPCRVLRCHSFGLIVLSRSLDKRRIGLRLPLLPLPSLLLVDLACPFLLMFNLNYDSGCFVDFLLTNCFLSPPSPVRADQLVLRCSERAFARPPNAGELLQRASG